MLQFYTQPPQAPAFQRFARQGRLTEPVSLNRTLRKLVSSFLMAFLGMTLLASQANAADIYLAPTASGLGDGSSWTNAANGNTYMASTTFMGATIAANTHFYLKAGIYTVNNGAYAYLGLNNTIQGSFPASATGTDKSGYNPTDNATTINVQGTYLLSTSTGGSAGASTIELKGIRFISSGTGSAPVFNGSSGLGAGASPGILKATDLYVANFTQTPFYLNSSAGPTTQSIFTNCVFYNNSSQLGGGAIFVGATGLAPIKIVGCSFIGNTATTTNNTGGGAIASFSNGTIIDSYFCNNSGGSGGALSNANTSFPPVSWTITGSTFYNNKATVHQGGAIYAFPGALHISNTNFYNNTANDGGGAIYKGSNSSSDVTNNITDCIFYGNSVTGIPGGPDGNGGGAIGLYMPSNNDLPITRCKFVNNSTVSSAHPGGAIYLYNFNTTNFNSVSLDQCLFFGNTSQGSSTTLGADFVASNAGPFGIYTKFVIKNTKVQLSAAASPPYLTYNGNPASLPWPYDFSGGGNTPNNTDNGGVTAFAGSCPSAITPVAINVTGQVWDDVNGNVVFEGSENGTNAGGPLYVNLVDGTGTVVASTTVSATGSYTLTAPINVTGYKLVLTNTATANTPGSLPSQWVNTGENVNGSNPATQSATLGQIELITGTTSVTAQNFGIEHLPTPGSGVNTVPNPGGTTPVTVPANTFTNITPSNDNGDTPPGSVTAIHITVFPSNVTSLTINGTVYTSLPAGGIIVPTDGSGAPSVPILVDPTNDANPVSFTFTAIDNAGKESTTTGTAVLNFTGVPDLSPVIYARPSSISGTKPITVVVEVYELNGASTSGLITVKLSKDPKVSLSFTNTATSVGGQVVQNSAWSFDDVSDDDYYVLTTNQVIAAGDLLAFGLSGTLTPGATSGTLTFTTVIGPGSGGEVLITNNTDADKIDFFQQ